jgi:hypothetical protein
MRLTGSLGSVPEFGITRMIPLDVVTRNELDLVVTHVDDLEVGKAPSHQVQTVPGVNIFEGEMNAIAGDLESALILDHA